MILERIERERVANSTPIVVFEFRSISLRVKRRRRLDLPTPLSPIRTTGGWGSDGWLVRIGFGRGRVWSGELGRTHL